MCQADSNIPSSPGKGCSFNRRYWPANPAAARASPTATMELACRERERETEGAGEEHKNIVNTHSKTIMTSCPEAALQT